MIQKHVSCAQPSRFAWRRNNPQGVVLHDIVCPDSWNRDRAARLLLPGVTQTNGKTIPPPIYHFIIDSDGYGWRLAENAAKTNNAGSCDPAAVQRMTQDETPQRPALPRGKNPNRLTISVAFVRNGQRPPTPTMWRTAVRLCAALCRDHRWTANRVVAHRELTTRKVDPGRFDMGEFRRDVAETITNGGRTPDRKLVHGSTDPQRPLLTPGYEGLQILPAQNRLVDVGLLRQPTGVYDRETETAILIYQRCHRLVADGKIGLLTWKALLN